MYKKSAIIDEQALSQRLVALSEKSGYNIIQNNGQRVFAPPDHKKRPIPPQGSEVFIGRIPRFVFEDELVPHFERVGPLYNFRLMLDFDGKNRGFAFASYFNPEDANRAVQLMNGFEIRPNVPLGVYKSVDNRRLFVGNIPIEITKEQLFEGLNHYVSDISNIIMYQDKYNDKLNRGYAFVEFKDHCSAAIARRQLSPASLILFGSVLHVDWADPLPEVDPNQMAQVSFFELCII